MRYAEFAARQAQIRSSYAAGVAAARVAARLKGGRPARLPTDRPLTARRSFRGEHFDVPFGPGQAGELVPPTGTTTAIFLVAAMAATLHQITGQSDLVLGTTVSGRAGSATEDAVGPYAELRALRVAIPPGTTWSTLLAYVREQFLLAHDEHEVAFLDIVEALGDRPEAGCSPVFDIGINVVPVRASPGRLGSVWGPGARHHLWLTAMQGADTMSLRVEYSTELFDRETVDAFVDRYRDTARHYATSGDVPVSAPLMPLDQHPADDLGLLL
jgi:non-ribosomal peptide synthetase component F